jgi:twitching motility protein PilT
VGRDTPSFEQALLDALREDPDVLMVGEMREPQCMRLTLNAAETGHLVLATVHSSNVAEALQRIVLAFPAEIQAGIQAQLADCMQAVVCQRLVTRSGVEFSVPECEILIGTSAARACIRQGNFYKLPPVMETGAAEGMWTRERYAAWLDRKSGFADPGEALADAAEVLPEPAHRRAAKPPAGKRRKPAPARDADGVLVIDSPPEEPAEILSELTKSK